jgi:hypothetical protein
MTRLGVPGGPAGGRRGRCLGDRVTAYVDRAMDPETLLHWDRHLAVCDRCRAAVEEERRVLSALRSAAAPPPGDLRSMLLAVAAEACGPSPADEPATGLRVPPVPVAPVPVVDRGAPAFHRSARRATVFAGLAAGATAAAAWTVAVAGAAAPSNPGSVTAPSSSVTPAVQRSRTAPPGFAPAAFRVQRVNLATTTPTRQGGLGQPGTSAWRGSSAQSTP